MASPEPGLPALTDDELTALALAAERDPVLGPDAVPLAEYLETTDGLLPAWYMPAAQGRVRSRWKIALLIVLIVAFLLIDGVGLCNTYGQLVVA